jgi:hypothetical protein
LRDDFGLDAAAAAAVMRRSLAVLLTT